MKKIFNLLTLFALCGSAAWSQSIAINESNAAAGTRIIKTDNIKGKEARLDDSITNRGVVLFAAGYQSAPVAGKVVETYFVDLNIVHNDNRLGCLDENKSRVVLHLEDGSSVECMQISENDCDLVAFHGAFALMPKGGSVEAMRENFEKLKDKGITRIDIHTTEKMLSYNVKKDWKGYLRSHFELIDSTVKRAAK